MLDQTAMQKAATLDLITALVYRQDKRVGDLCHLSPFPTYNAYIRADGRMSSLDDCAESPTVRMRQVLNAGAKNGAWSTFSQTTLSNLLESRLRAFGTSNLCSERILGFAQREDLCVVRFQEVNTTGQLDKISLLRVHFINGKVGYVDEFIDERSTGFERAVGR